MAVASGTGVVVGSHSHGSTQAAVAKSKQYSPGKISKRLPRCAKILTPSPMGDGYTAQLPGTLGSPRCLHCKSFGEQRYSAKTPVILFTWSPAVVTIQSSPYRAQFVVTGPYCVTMSPALAAAGPQNSCPGPADGSAASVASTDAATVLFTGKP